jgi:hypothetical protein
MKRLTLLLLLALACVAAGQAQTTTITATVTDSAGTVWLNTPYTITWGGKGTPSTTSGQSFTLSFSGTTNSSGQLSQVVTDIAYIVPANSFWNLCVTSATSSPQTYCVAVPATGVSYNATTLISNAVQPPSITGGPLARAYADSEVTAVGGNQYFNIGLVTPGFRCYASSWQPCGGTGTVTSVTGTPNQIDVANGTTTPVVSIDSNYLPTYAGPLTASTVTATTSVTSPLVNTNGWTINTPVVLYFEGASVDRAPHAGGSPVGTQLPGGGLSGNYGNLLASSPWGVGHATYYNDAVDGSTTAQALARYTTGNSTYGGVTVPSAHAVCAAATAAGTRAFFFVGTDTVVNDGNGSVPVGTSQTNLQSLVADAQADGCFVVMFTSPDIDYNAQIIINQNIRNLTIGSGDGTLSFVADMATWIANTTDTNYWDQTGPHPTVLGHKVIAANLLACMLAGGCPVNYSGFLAQPPVVTTASSGSGTYTTPINALYLLVELCGAGGGGSGSGATAGAGQPGSANTTFGSSLLTAPPGGGAPTGSTTGGIGASIATGGDDNFTGGPGDPWNNGGTFLNGATGAPGPFGGAGRGGGAGGNNGSAATNPCAGGGGAGDGGTGSNGGGGGSGAYLRKLIRNPLATYAYSIATGGTGGTAGTGGNAGGAGGSGYLKITAVTE